MLHFSRERTADFVDAIRVLQEEYSIGAVTHVGEHQNGSIAFFGEKQSDGYYMCLMFQPDQLHAYVAVPRAEPGMRCCPEEYEFEADDFKGPEYDGHPAEDFFTIRSQQSLF